jgi:hypothetical protein
MATTDISFELISKPILDLDDPSYILSSETHDDPLRHPKHRSHEAHKEELEEQWQQLEHSCVVASEEWMDKAKPLRIEPKHDPNSELKSISLINMTHPSLEEALVKINQRVTNP